MKLPEMLNNWKESLDKQIGDTQAEISIRWDNNKHAVDVRADVIELIEYLKTNKFPEPVARALEHCLIWSPFTGDGGWK